MKAQNSLFLCDHLGTNLSVKYSRSGANGIDQTCQTGRKSEIEAESNVRGDVGWGRSYLRLHSDGSKSLMKT